MKRILSLCIAALLLAALFVLPTIAEDTTKVMYGADEITLSLLCDLSGEGKVDGFGSLGVATYGDGQLLIESSHNMFDAYGMDTEAFTAAGELTGVRYIVFSVKNNSDGDIYFCFQPTANGSNIFISGTLAKENPVVMLSDKGKVSNAKFSADRAINGRDGFLIPQNFAGYIFIPVGILADLNSLSTPYFTGDATLQGSGYHTKPDDATYIELVIFDIFTCGELPEYKEPEQPTEPAAEETTEAPTEETTEPETVPESDTVAVSETVTEPVTESVSTAEEKTEAPSETVPDSVTATEDTTADSSSGCASVLSVSALLLLVASAAIVYKKH